MSLLRNVASGRGAGCGFGAAAIFAARAAPHWPLHRNGRHACAQAATFHFSQLQLLYGVRPSDPLTLLSVSAVLIGAAVFASYVPARQATQVDPIMALHYE